jgi:site-specific recombinase XerD
MLEKLIKRAYYLKKHLEAPLLEERENYLRQWADKGAARSSLKGVANYLLRIVEFLELERTETQVSMECIEKSAKAWGELHYNHPMKQKYSKTGEQRFIWFSIDWLKQIKRLAPLIEEQEPLFMRLFERRHALMRHTSAPLLRERLGYLQYRVGLNASDSTLRKIAHYQLCIMELLPFRELRPVYSYEIERAAIEWASNPKVLRRKSNYSKVSKLRFTHDATEWFKMLGCLVEQQAPVSPFHIYQDQYLGYMGQQQGLATETIKGRSFILKDFLINLSKVVTEFSAIGPGIIDGILTLKHERDGLSRRTIQSYASVVRSFLRYAESQHWCSGRVADSIMAPRVYRFDTLPSSPQWKDVQALFAACSTDDPTDIRDYAIMMLLAVYGLRRSEVANLALQDIDWNAEKIHLRRSKRSRPQVFPLAPTVGTAMLRYLKDVRPEHCKLRELFIAQRSPYKALTPGAVYAIVNRRLKPLNLPIKHHGPHALRHACATHLINEGVSLKEISDHLGHRGLETTRIYSKVDLVNLRKVAEQNWEGLL